MRKFVCTAAIVGFAALLGCATIVSKSESPVRISSAPDGATVTIVDRYGGAVFTGTTPATAVLKHGNGFFQRAIYTIRVEKPGYKQQQTVLQATVNGWYFGNIIFGGFLGLLIVDPATGAMYTLPQTDVQLTLEQASTWLSPPEGNELRVLNLDQVPAGLRPSLVRVSH